MNNISYYNFMMNSSSNSSLNQNNQESLEFQRFQGIWNNIKKAKESSFSKVKDKSVRKQMSSVKKAIEIQQQKNLQTRLMITEKQLTKSKQNTTLLLKKLSQAQQQIQYLEFQLQKQSKSKIEMGEEIQELKKQLTKTKHQLSTHRQNSMQQQMTPQYAQRLQKNNELKTKEIDRLNLKIKSLQLTIKNMEMEFKNFQQSNNQAIKNNQKKQNSFYKNQANFNDQQLKGAQILQLNQANLVIQRLLILLKNTEEYKRFANSVQDIKQLHFLYNIPSRLKLNQLIQKVNQRKKMCSCMEIKIDEKYLWTPSICYKTLLQLKLKYNSFSQECIQEILYQLNKIYLGKEEHSVKKLKQIYQSQITRLKKKTEEKYDQLVARKQIQRLKKELSQKKYGNQKEKQSQQNNLQILRSIGQYEDQLRLKERQISLLNQRIKLSQIQNTSYDKIVYLEGTLWIIDKVLLQIQNNSENFKVFQTKFRNRIQDSGQMTEEDWLNSYKYFFQNNTELQNDLIQKLLQMKEGTLKKMGSQRIQLRQSKLTQNAAKY